GVRSGDVAEAVVFTDFAGTNNSDTGMILRGGARLQPAASALRGRGWAASAFRGYKIYSGGDDCLAQLRSGFLVVGSKVAVERGIAFSFTRSGDSMPINLVALMKDEGAASLVSGTLTLLKGATSLLPARDESPADRQARQVFEGMSVMRTREVISVRLTIPD